MLQTSEVSVASDAEKWRSQPFLTQRWLPLDNKQQTIHQRGPPHTRAVGAGPAPHRISKLRAYFRALTSQVTVLIAPSWIGKSPERAPPDPGPCKGIHKSMLMELVSSGAVQGPEVAGLGEFKPKLLVNLLPNVAHYTPGHQKLAAPTKKFAWQACRVSGRLMGWLALVHPQCNLSLLPANLDAVLLGVFDVPLCLRHDRGDLRNCMLEKEAITCVYTK
eukprot:1160407-Pelagomonas_calceolata.AAC.1